MQQARSRNGARHWRKVGHSYMLGKEVAAHVYVRNNHVERVKTKIRNNRSGKTVNTHTNFPHGTLWDCD